MTALLSTNATKPLSQKIEKLQVARSLTIIALTISLSLFLRALMACKKQKMTSSTLNLIK